MLIYAALYACVNVAVIQYLHFTACMCTAQNCIFLRGVPMAL